jgi:glutaredoxin
MNNNRYIVIARETCPFCVKAIQLLERRDDEVKVIYFTEKQNSLLSEFKNAYSHKTVPMIFERKDKDIHFIGGYTDLVDHLL